MKVGVAGASAGGWNAVCGEGIGVGIVFFTFAFAVWSSNHDWNCLSRNWRNTLSS